MQENINPSQIHEAGKQLRSSEKRGVLNAAGASAQCNLPASKAPTYSSPQKGSLDPTCHGETSTPCKKTAKGLLSNGVQGGVGGELPPASTPCSKGQRIGARGRLTEGLESPSACYGRIC